MQIHETFLKKFMITTDKSKLSVHFVYNYLSNESYWAKNILVETVRKSIEGCCCFARVVTDCNTFVYLADVFILGGYRGKGLAKAAHGLYTKFGFSALDKPERIMGFKPFEEYRETNS